MFSTWGRDFDGDRVLADRPLYVGSICESTDALAEARVTHIVRPSISFVVPFSTFSRPAPAPALALPEHK